jgi:hypothetical protein
MKTELRQRLPEKLLEHLKSLVEMNNKLRQARPQLGLSENTIDSVYQIINEHRLNAFGRIDAELESGKISAGDAQKQKDAWDTDHSFK